MTLKRVNNWLYWGDDRVGTTCAGGEQQCRQGGLSLHAQQIWQTADTSWPLGGWTFDVRCSHRAQILSALSWLDPISPVQNACRLTHKQTHARCSFHAKHWHRAEPERSIYVKIPSCASQSSNINNNDLLQVNSDRQAPCWARVGSDSMSQRLS